MRRVAVCLALLLFVSLVGCGPSIPPRPAPPTAGLSGIAQLAHTPSRTPRPTSTATPHPTPTSTATPILTPTPTPTPRALGGSIELEPAQILPGHTLLVRLYASRPANATAFVGDTALPLFPGDEAGQYVALFGVQVWTPPGEQVVSAVLRDARGETALLSATLGVLPADYPIEYIDLLPGREELLDPQIVQQEWARVQPVLHTVTFERLWQGPFVTPTEGYMSSPFGSMRSYDGGPPSSYHNGVDISNITGTLVVACGDGRVALAEELKVRGSTVILDHGWGVHSIYMHLSAIEVEEGDLVKQGQPIGRMGATGLVTGPHLHWELRLGLIPVDPREWVQRALP